MKVSAARTIDWTLPSVWAKIIIDLDPMSEHPVWVVTAHTPLGTMRMLGLLRLEGRCLFVEDAHVEGLFPGALSRAGLNAIGYRLMEVADVDRLVIQGAVRTTGARPGHRPAAFRLARPRNADADRPAGAAGDPGPKAG